MRPAAKPGVPGKENWSGQILTSRVTIGDISNYQFRYNEARPIASRPWAHTSTTKARNDYGKNFKYYR